MSEPNVYYWNTADDRDHTHKRIEWVQNNGYLVMMNIKVESKLFNSIKVNDIIVAYEPKHHKTSCDSNGKDGKCMSCEHGKHNGKQGFTHGFKVRKQPTIFKSFEDELVYEKRYGVDFYRSWKSTDKHNASIETHIDYSRNDYYKNNKKYIIPVDDLGPLTNFISTNKKSKSYEIYSGSVIKGFNMIFDDDIKDNIIQQFVNV